MSETCPDDPDPLAFKEAISDIARRLPTEVLTEEERKRRTQVMQELVAETEALGLYR